MKHKNAMINTAAWFAIQVIASCIIAVWLVIPSLIFGDVGFWSAVGVTLLGSLYFKFKEFGK